MKRWRILLIGTYLALAVISFSANVSYNARPEVVLTRAEYIDLRESAVYTGALFCNKFGLLPASPVKVERVCVAAGDQVRKGDLLAVLDWDDTAIAAWRNHIEQPEPPTDLPDLTALLPELDIKSVWEQIAAAAGADYESVICSEHLVCAPADGTVLSVSVVPDSYAGIVSPMVVIGETGEMRLSVSVPESEIGRIRVGQYASVTGSAFPGKSFDGEVERIEREASRSFLGNSEATVPVTVRLNEKDDFLMPGFSASAKIVFETRENVLQIPLEWIRQEENGEEYLLLYRDAKACRQPVRCVYHASGYAEVFGIEPDSFIIPQAAIAPDQKVRLAEDWRQW